MAQSLESARNREKYLQDLSDDELMKEWTEVSERWSKDRELLLLFSQEHQDRTRLAALKIEPGDERLLQRVAVQGIESEEKAGDL